jgi:putative glycosyltransferase (TIGR04348 family)
MARVHLITPALADARNGNWQTAFRWQKFLATHEVLVSMDWPSQHAPMPRKGTSLSATLDASSAPTMIALHARRSAGAIARFSKTGQRIALVLTGTDLYRDIHSHDDAKQSLALADFLVVLNEQGVRALPSEYWEKTRVIFQSAGRLVRSPRTISPTGARYFNLALVGHLRAEKDPLTALTAMELLAARSVSRPHCRLIHVGGAKDEALARQFNERAHTLGHRIVLKGSLDHCATRQVIKRCDLLVLPSIMEGGANVLIEAVTSGVPVLASAISGSIGMLGENYQGYFPVGDASALAALISRCRDDFRFLELLRDQCETRARLFLPEGERRAVNALVDDLLTRSRAGF